MRIFSVRFRSSVLVGFAIALMALVACSPFGNGSKSILPGATQAEARHNVVIVVMDGLRSKVVNPEDMPALSDVRQQGVNFVNSHSLFPTFTTANASAIATGHYLGDTGDFSNTINVGFRVKSAERTLVPFLENNAVLAEVNQHHKANYLNEDSLLAIARKAGLSTAAVGKIGPVLIQDITQNRGEPTIIVDDATGSETGIPFSAEMTERMKQDNLSLVAFSRGENGRPGTNVHAGTTYANIVQQQYFADVTTKVILPLFKERQKPFVLVYWSRDPDGTQHNQGDSLNQLTPGINGSTSQAARQNADKNLAQLRSALKDLGLEATTDIFVTSDHGFSTISKESKTSYAATLTFPLVPKGFLPPGFLAIDLAHGLRLPLFDPDTDNRFINLGRGQYSKNALIGENPKKPTVLIAGNGGSDLLYVLNTRKRQELTQQIVALLLQQDYVSGLFVDDALQPIPGTLPLSAVGLRGKSRMPVPSIFVNFRSFDTGCPEPTTCGVEVADTGLQQGQGMHGSFSRADTYNTMAAIGPDFKSAFTDSAPVSNADIAQTIAHILKLKIPRQGSLVGRILEESLVGGANTVDSKAATIASAAATNGLKTVLRYQTVGKTRYFDAAGFPGRTLGLEPKSS